MFSARGFVGRWILFIAAILLFVGIAGGVYWWHIGHPLFGTPAAVAVYKTSEESKSVYVRFDMEAYDKILANYWQKASDADLAGLLQLALQKAENLPTAPALATKDRAGAAQMLATAFAATSTEEARKQLALNTLIVTLYNLAPAGRNGLLSAKQEVALRQEVANVDPTKDLYADLGVAKSADTGAIDAAYKAKTAQLAAATSSDAKAQLAQAAYAHQVLTDANEKARYDQGGVEPTVFAHTLGRTLYLYIKQISPTTLQEFAQAVDAASTTPALDSMILDVRGNIGGALDFAAYFLGLFVGQNQYAFDLLHQGDYQPQRTAVGKFTELDRFKETAILTDNMTQSTAEVVTAMFKRFNLARVVGDTTRGWGTVENTVALDTVIDPAQKYSLLLVQYLTLRDDGQPVEGKGVDPDINIADKNWKAELSGKFRSASLIQALSQEAANPPLK